jgi:hypothetical protein
MDEQERQRQLERMRASELGEQIEAAWALAKSADPTAFAAVLEVLERPDTWNPEVVSIVLDGLVTGAPATLPLVLAYLEQTPLSPGGDGCAYILGEVAYLQASPRDVCIVPALLRALAASLPMGTRAASTAVCSLRECARSGPVPEAEEAMLHVLSLAEKEDAPYFWTLENAIEVLYANQKEQLLPALRTRLQALPPDHQLALTIEDFLERSSRPP